MEIKELLSIPIFLLLLFLTYIIMWTYLNVRTEVRKKKGPVD
ncbi:hypothetical protein [Sutcliffiella cohnii]|nr:hypothetical protein [Sutcliffiella cohnii]